MSLSSRALLGASAAVAIALAVVACTDTFPNELSAYDADVGDSAPPLEDSGPLPIPEAGGDAGDAGDATAADGEAGTTHDAGDAEAQDSGDASDANFDAE